jgi:hypothetical protein
MDNKREPTLAFFANQNVMETKGVISKDEVLKDLNLVIGFVYCLRRCHFLGVCKVEWRHNQ